MKSIAKLISMALVFALDFCAGAFIAAAVFHLLHINLSDWGQFFSLATGGILCVLPDLLDFWTQSRGGKKVETDHHRQMPHYPLLGVVVGGILGYIVGAFFGQPVAWAIIAPACLASHYIHDMTGPFGAIMLFWPCRWYFSFAQLVETVEGDSVRERYIRGVGTEKWLADYWQRLSILSFWELGLALAFAVTTWWYLDPRAWWLPVLALGSWGGLMVCIAINRKPAS